MEPEISQDPATCPISEPYQSSPCPLASFLKIHFNIILHLHVGLPSALVPSSFPTKSLCARFLSPIHATRSAHLSPLDLITRIMFGEDYRSYSSSVCSLPQYDVTPSVLGPKCLPQHPVLERPYPILTPTFRTSIYFFSKFILTHCIEMWKYEHVL